MDENEEIPPPVAGGRIAAVLLLALLLNLIPLHGWAASARPDVVAVAVVYWSVHQAHRIGLLPVWVLGLVMDVADASLFGQHALAYCAAAVAAMFLHRRIRMFSMGYQIAHVLAVLMGQQMVQLAVRLADDSGPPNILYFVSSLTGAAAWPLAVGVLALVTRQRGRPHPVG